MPGPGCATAAHPAPELGTTTRLAPRDLRRDCAWTSTHRSMALCKPPNCGHGRAIDRRKRQWLELIVIGSWSNTSKSPRRRRGFRKAMVVGESTRPTANLPGLKPADSTPAMATVQFLEPPCRCQSLHRLPKGMLNQTGHQVSGTVEISRQASRQTLHWKPSGPDWGHNHNRQGKSIPNEPPQEAASQ